MTSILESSALVLGSRYIPSKGSCTFFQLPGELRNKIYEHVVEKKYYVIEWVHGNHKSKSLTYQRRERNDTRQLILDPYVGQRRRQLDYPRRALKQTLLPTGSIPSGPAALLSVCNQMHRETCSIFYSKSLFHFYGLGALRLFLHNLSPMATKSLTRLAIRYRAYGETNLIKDQIWKQKHDHLWQDLMWRISVQCESLAEISLFMTLNKAPSSSTPFGLVNQDWTDDQWTKALWAFQDIGIKRCWLRLYCPTKEDDVLEMDSKRWRKEILGDAWDEQREVKRDAYGFDTTRQASEGQKC